VVSRHQSDPESKSFVGAKYPEFLFQITIGFVEDREMFQDLSSLSQTASIEFVANVRFVMFNTIPPDIGTRDFNEG
jgi:hypothetical protein